MKRYLQKVKDLVLTFQNFDIQQVFWKENAQADALVRLATCAPHDMRAQVLFEVIEEPSIIPATILQLETESCWMDPLVDYLRDGTLPHNCREIRKLRQRASRFLLHEGRLYKRAILCHF